MTMAAIFIAQATNTALTLTQQLGILAVLLLTSKGAAAVTGGGFVTLAATLSAIHTIPVTGLALIVGIDRFMSEARTITNLIGNGVGTIVIAKWDGALNTPRMLRVLNGETDDEADRPEEVLLSDARMGAGLRR
jgi:aerobic C4-dicarboxylate transport protein